MGTALSKAVELYAAANRQFSWTLVMKYGCQALVAYTLYAFFMKPFLSPLRKVDTYWHLAINC